MSFRSVLNQIKVISEPVFAKGRGVPGKVLGFDADGFGIPVDPATGLQLGKILFVDATNGVDARAVKGSIAQPYKTLTAAKNAASVGDTIHVFPGLYNQDTYIAKNGVDWFFELGARVIPFNQNSAIFSDATEIVVCRVRGYGYFKSSGNYNDDHTVVELSKNGSFLDMEALEVGSVEVWGTGARARFANCRFTNGLIAAYNNGTKLELINCDIINTFVTMR